MTPVTRDVAVLGAPSGLGIVPHADGSPQRLDLAPDALREHGLVARVGGRDLGDVEPPPGYPDVERPPGRCRNEDELVAFSHDLAERIAECRRQRQFVLLLGGDCSIVLGTLLGLRSADGVAPGLVYMDAHADFATLEESPSGTACSMTLALAVAREDQALSRLRADGALTSADRLAHVGRRDDIQPSYGAAALEASGALDLPMSAIGSRPAGDVAREAVAQATAGGGGFWVHFDADVLDPSVLSAMCDPAPGGIGFAQATELLRTVLGHPAALGMQLTLYDPTLDPDGRGAEDLVGLLEGVLAGRASRA